MLVAKAICKSYHGDEILKQITLSIHPGEMVAIMGPSGAGKTTLLHLLSTLDKPDSGALTLDGTDLTKLEGNALATFRNKKIGFVFQFHNLLPEFTLFENICIPGYIGTCAKKEVAQKADDLLSLLGISHRKNHLPEVVSGGERQRAAVARALINSPSIVFADEPSGNLDSKNAEVLHALFLALSKQLKQTFVLVTHNQSLAAIADSMLLLKDGILQPASRF
ncbi:MAG: ABC transporter ATP-binding protein [Candidatus Cardinium sp.]|uniref:ABC transporter ATP-binding protein n=1 Tax=Cardinium endosymbiont of Dermatophagoides farinae TaxID=2597823 RepID=UPI0011844425|nr:ABC transporter ATP-binding protein [Cardinium endosymbiont of Dermatophagoides farinae]TSJ81263.1 ABC transporter ATP-binding protein [Cardinium endosymbiont of Dermatophagoides farinae]UWW97321.1 MAG: ABC transporter ATP-binding protein [Candidatus Cardinium sp.]